MWWYDGAGWAGGLVMALTTVALCGVLAVVCITVWRAVERSGRPEAGARTPERLLDERLARGEIDEEEYTRRRDLLRSGR